MNSHTLRVWVINNPLARLSLWTSYKVIRTYGGSVSAACVGSFLILVRGYSGTIHVSFQDPL